MLSALRPFFAAAWVLVSLLVWAAPSAAQSAPAKKASPDLSGFRPTMMETMLLPQYCWGQFNPQFQGGGMQAYNLPPREVCGERMNHFCPALVSLARAKKDQRMRGYWIGVANDHIEYTLSALREVPRCPLSAEIERYAIEIKSMRGSVRR
jgi:hypothetical protein